MLSEEKTRAELEDEITRLQFTIDQMEEWYMKFSEISSEGIIIHQNLVIKEVNPAACFILGFEKADFMGKNISDFVDRKELEHIAATVTRKDENNYELNVRTKSGSRVVCEIVAKTTIYNGEMARVIVFRDVSGRRIVERKLKEVSERYKKLSDATSEGIVIHEDGIIVEANHAAYKLFKYDEPEFIGKEIFDLLDKETAKFVKKNIREKREGAFEIFIKPRTGAKIFCEYIGKEIIYNNRTARVVTFRDLSTRKDVEKLSLENQEQKKAEEKLKQSLKEKEVLLKEVHHRVKNNLQVISSILNLQSSYVADKKTLDILKESQNRIKAMSFIHESLYQTKDFTSVNLSEYIHNISTNLLYSFKPKGKKISLKQETSIIFLNLDQAIPCGLIINELMSNSLKYAFTKKTKGIITVNVKVDKNENVQLIIADDGSGLKGGLNFKSTQTLGLQLVMLLVSQLKGTIRLENKKGARFTIEFNKRSLN